MGILHDQKAQTFFRETIDLLGLMNLDEDHLSDFKNVMQDCTRDTTHASQLVPLCRTPVARC